MNDLCCAGTMQHVVAGERRVQRSHSGSAETYRPRSPPASSRLARRGTWSLQVCIQAGLRQHPCQVGRRHGVQEVAHELGERQQLRRDVAKERADQKKHQMRRAGRQREERNGRYITQVYGGDALIADPLVWSTQRYALLVDRVQPGSSQSGWGSGQVSSSSSSSTCGPRVGGLATIGVGRINERERQPEGPRPQVTKCVRHLFLVGDLSPRYVVWLSEATAWQASGGGSARELATSTCHVRAFVASPLPLLSR